MTMDMEVRMKEFCKVKDRIRAESITYPMWPRKVLRLGPRERALFRNAFTRDFRSMSSQGRVGELPEDTVGNRLERDPDPVNDALSKTAKRMLKGCQTVFALLGGAGAGVGSNEH